MLTARCEYVSRTRSNKVSKSAPRSTDPANNANSSASLAAWRASRVRWAALSTNTATALATSISTMIVSALSGS